MPIAYHARGRVDKRNRLGPAYYAALYDDEPLGAGVLTETTMPGSGILSYLDPFDDAAGNEATSGNPIFASSLGAAESAFTNQRYPQFAGVDSDDGPDIGETLAPGVLTETPMNRPGILSYREAFDDAVEQDDVAANPVFVSNFDTDAPPLMDKRLARFPETGFSAVPNSDDAGDSGIAMRAPRLYPGILSDQEELDDTSLQQAVMRPPVLVANDDGAEAAVADRSLTGFSNTKLNAAPANGIVPGAAGLTGSIALATLPRWRNASYQEPGGSKVKQKVEPANAPPASPKKSAFGHAGEWESLIPFWGAGRNTLADLQEGNYASAAINAGLLASDFFLWGAPAKFIFKAGQFGFKKSGIKGALEGSKYAIKGPGRITAKDKWGSARRKMKRRGMVVQDHEGHHLIPQAGWGKRGWGSNLPDAIKHHPLNIMWLPRDVHQRLHRNWMGLPEFTTRQKIWHGTPRWSKALAGEVAGRGVAPVVEMTEDWAKK